MITSINNAMVCPICKQITDPTKRSDMAMYEIHQLDLKPITILGEHPICCGYAWWGAIPVEVYDKHRSLINFLFHRSRKIPFMYTYASMFKVIVKKIK